MSTILGPKHLLWEGPLAGVLCSQSAKQTI